MNVEHSAILNLSQLLLNTSMAYEVEGQGLLMPDKSLLEQDNLRLADPLEWDLRVSSTGGDDAFILEGSVAGTALLECRRCLEEVAVNIQSSFIYPMLFRPGTVDLSLLEKGEDEDDSLIFGKPEVDFSNLLTQVFAIDSPLTALCKETCKGLSPEGINLNEHPELIKDEPIQESEKASPFAVLKDFDV